MSLLTVEALSKSYGVKRLFEHISFVVEDHDRIGLIGVNGTGKTTLLRVLAGAESADSGRMTVRSGAVIEYLPQNPEYDPDATVLDYVLRKLDRGIAEFEAKRMLSLFGIERYDDRMGDLSGGGRKRAMLAGVLIRESDLLILDEPTNHLDTQAVEVLERQLKRRRGALLMITHDRYFLDRIASRMLELDRGQLFSYAGNYASFLEKKAERLELEQAAERKRHNLYRRELEWIRRGAKARTTKQKARIDRFEQIRDAAPEREEEGLDIGLAGSRLGRKVIELQSLSKSFDSRTLIDDFSYLVQRRDRIGIIGPNGSGKSTLLKLISGQIAPDRGVVDIGSTVRIGFYTQESEDMDGSKRVIEYVKDAAEQVRTADGTTISAAQMLERFQFAGEQQWTPIERLSGGEKRRLYLLRILMESPNVLLLDEPTNDLDIQTLAVLEDYLEDFAGAVLSVSHDRYFLDRTADKILSFEDGGRIEHHEGNYSEYQELREKRTAERFEQGTAPSSAANAATRSDHPGAARSERPRALKMSWREQQDFEQIDGWIQDAENELQRVTEAINAAGSDFEALQRLTEEQQALEKKLEELLERWTYLNELAEQIERQKAEK